MPINVELRGESGDVVGRAGGDGILERLAETSDTTSACLRFLDPYGNTVFNHSQARVLAAELRGRLSELGATEADSVARVIRLAEQCAAGVHLYLWCIGD